MLRGDTCQLRRFQALLSAVAFVSFGAGIAAQEAEEADEEETAIVEEADEAEEAEDADEGGVEEVIVTGSFIRRDSFDLPSPIDTIDELDLEFAATPDIGDVIFDQTYQNRCQCKLGPVRVQRRRRSGRPVAGRCGGVSRTCAVWVLGPP